MPIVTVNWIEGKTADMKRKVAKGITDVLQKEAGSPPESVSIIFNDLKKGDFAKAGVLHSDK